MSESALYSGSAAAQEYVRVRIDGVNLQTMLRMQEHAPEAVEELLLEGGTVCVARLLEARAGGALAAVFTAAPLRAAAEHSVLQAGEAASGAGPVCPAVQRICVRSRSAAGIFAAVGTASKRGAHECGAEKGSSCRGSEKAAEVYDG